MVGFFGFRRASAAACTPCAPDWWTTGGGRAVASGMECSDDAVEAVAEGDTAGFEVPLGGLLLVGAAISLNLRAVLAGAARKARWVENWVREGSW